MSTGDHPDESIIPKSVAQRLGFDALERLNLARGGTYTPIHTPADPYDVGDQAQGGYTPSEVRTVSASGGEKGVKAEAYALLPSEALDEIARVYDFGANKYAAHNWRKGYEWSKSFSAMMRHLWAFWRGEDLDPESGLSHLGHAGFHVLGLLTFWLKRDLYGKFDDRYKDD